MMLQISDLFRTTAFRWSAVVATAFTTLSLVLFGFIYWQTAGYEARELDGNALREARTVTAVTPPEAAAQLQQFLASDEHRLHYALLLAPDGRRLLGNITAMPPGLPVDGRSHLVSNLTIEGNDADADGRVETMRGVAVRLSDGSTAVVGFDTDELAHTQSVLLRAFGLGLIPVVALSLLGGMLLGRRALDHVAAMDRAIARVTRGDIAERLPVRGTHDEFDRLARSVNAMLDDMERLFEEIRGVGNSIAHDLRTPLTRARVRLERSREAVRTEAEFRDAIGEALQWLDQTFGIIAAILRIGEVEHGRRRAGFSDVALAPLLREVADLYEPLAEDNGVAIALALPQAGVSVEGDRELIFEAVANLVDNALKFSPAGSRCSLALLCEEDEAVIEVADAGPGIPAEERLLVLRRFYRSEQSRSSAGNGLGLALVAAVTRLHGFGLRISDNHPGCRVEIRAPVVRPGPAPTAPPLAFTEAADPAPV